MKVVDNLELSGRRPRAGDGPLTFPFKVVAANNLASTGIEKSCSIACVVFHASDCNTMSISSM